MVNNNLNEVYIGTNNEINIIRKELEKIRTESLLKYPKEKTLANLKTEISIDLELFQKASDIAERTMSKYFINFKMLSLERYIINQPLGIGGFYGIPTGGYSHPENVGFTTLLNNDIIKNTKLRTMELFRNYFHDSIHANSYKSYKLNAEMQKPYRYQYGINFRDKNGVSYSSPYITKESPLKINLNIMMDGVTQIFASSFIKNNFKEIFQSKNVKTLEKEILNEIMFCRLEGNRLIEPKEFYRDILIPTKLFISFWGKEWLFNEIMLSIFSGKLNNLKSYFNKKMKVENSWEIIFKQRDFTEINIDR